MNRSFIVLNIFLLLFISSCASLPKNDNTPKIRDIRSIVPKELSYNNNQYIHNSSWWLKYKDKQLSYLINQALKTSPDIEVAQARVNNSLAQISQFNHTSKFSLSASAGYNGQYLSKNGINPPPISGKWYNDFNLGLGSSYEFDFWNKNRSLLEAAVGSSMASKASLDYSKLLLASSIAKNYFSIQNYLLIIQLLNDQKTIEQLILLNDQYLIKQGLYPNSILYPVQININNINTKIEQINNFIYLNKLTLISFVGGHKNFIMNLKFIRIPNLTSSTPNNIEYSFLSHRADLQAKKWLVLSSMDKVQYAKAAFYPSFSINGMIGLDSINLYNLLTLSSKTFNIGPTITLPIFNSGQLKSQLLISETDRNNTIAEYNKAIVDAVKEAYSSINNLMSLHKQMLIEKNNINIISNTLNEIKIKYNQGLVNKNTLLNNNLSLISEKLNILSIKYQTLIADISLIQSLGGEYNTNNKQRIIK